MRLNYAAAAAFIGIPVGTLRSMVARRQVPHYRLGPQLVRFDLDELEKWLREHSAAGNGGDWVILLVPVSLERAKQVVRDWHSHHDPMIGHMWSTGAIVDDELSGVVVVSRPIAAANQNGEKGAWLTLEVTRLCCKGVHHGSKYKNVASRLLGAACAAAENRGVRLMLSYTRIDEDGTCYRAAGWVPCAEIVEARDWTSGNKATRWLPGFYEPTTEKIDRVRWEWRPPQAIRAVCKMIFALGEWARAEQRRRRAA